MPDMPDPQIRALSDMVVLSKQPSQFWIKDEDKRIIEGWVSVEVVDRQGDIVPIDVLKQAMIDYMDRGGIILYGHSNRPVGKVLSWSVERHPETGALGIKIIAKIFNNHKQDDAVWNLIKQGVIRGFSIGGDGQAKEMIVKDENGNEIKVKGYEKIELNEISLVEQPANPLALITALNYFAKSADDASVRKLKQLAGLVSILSDYGLDVSDYADAITDLSKSWNEAQYRRVRRQILKTLDDLTVAIADDQLQKQSTTDSQPSPATFSTTQGEITYNVTYGPVSSQTPTTDSEDKKKKKQEAESSSVVQPEQPTTAPPPDQTQKSESVEKRAEPNWGRVKEKFKQLLDAYRRLITFLKHNLDLFPNPDAADEAKHEAETFLGIAESYAADIETEDIYTARKLLQDAIATFSTITTKLSEAGESKLPNFATLAKIIRRISAITYNFMFALYPPAPELMAKSIKKAVEDEEDFDDYGLPIPIAVSTAIYNLIGDLDNAKKQVLYADNLDAKTKLRAETLIRDSIIWMAQLRDIAFYRIYDTSKAIASIVPIVLDNLTEAKSLIADAVPDAADKIQSAISTLRAIRNKLKATGEPHPEPIPATIIAGSLSDLAEHDSSIAAILKSALCPFCDPSKPIKKTIADPQLAKVLIKSLPGQLIDPDDLPIPTAISKALPESTTVAQIRDLELPSFKYEITDIHTDFWYAVERLRGIGIPNDVINDFIQATNDAIDTISDNLETAQNRLADLPTDAPASSIPDDLKNLINITASQVRRLRHIAYIIDRSLRIPRQSEPTADDVRNWTEQLRAITSISEPDFILVKTAEPSDRILSYLLPDADDLAKSLLSDRPITKAKARIGDWDINTYADARELFDTLIDVYHEDEDKIYQLLRNTSWEIEELEDEDLAEALSYYCDRIENELEAITADIENLIANLTPILESADPNAEVDDKTVSMLQDLWDLTGYLENAANAIHHSRFGETNWNCLRQVYFALVKKSATEKSIPEPPILLGAEISKSARRYINYWAAGENFLHIRDRQFWIHAIECLVKDLQKHLEWVEKDRPDDQTHIQTLNEYIDILNYLKSELENLDCDKVFFYPPAAEVINGRYYDTIRFGKFAGKYSTKHLESELQFLRPIKSHPITCLPKAEKSITKSSLPYFEGLPEIKDEFQASQVFFELDAYRRFIAEQIEQMLLTKDIDPDIRQQALTSLSYYNSKLSDLAFAILEELHHSKVDLTTINTLLNDYWLALHPYAEIEDFLNAYGYTYQDIALEIASKLSKSLSTLTKSWTPVEKIVRRCYDAPSKWCVYSEKKDPKTGKRKKLGGPYDTKQEALKRLRQIEYFKRVNKARRRPPKSWFDRCVESVKRKNKNVKDPAALCAWIWYYWMSPSAKRKYAS